MSDWPDQPVIYEVNTAAWLGDLSRAAGRPVTLANVSVAEWDAITPSGVDAVWLMGVWERSPAGLALAGENPDVRAACRAALPDLRPEDLAGSPYCVHRYEVDPAFGGPEALALARAALATRGVRLVLDYVPNHVAPDHPWVTERPELLVRGDADDLATDPDAWLEIDGQILARGRDPYFPAWPDVLQLDAFSPQLRTATVRTLAGIAAQCDGIRCDMAMLMINMIFGKTWAGRTGPEPDEEFWPQVLDALHDEHPETVLLAEAYWDLEWALQQQGFDFCYDKRLYDRMMAGGALAIRDHLRATPGYQSQLVRFLENHDEPRVAARLGPDAERAAAIAVATLPGATLWHQGQFEGNRTQLPVFLARHPDEPSDRELAEWYRHLLVVVGAYGVRQGFWQLLGPEGWPDNQSCVNLLAWSWTAHYGARHLVVINYSESPAQGRIPLPWTDLGGRTWRLTDLFDGTLFERTGDGLTDPGLFVALDPWRAHLLSVTG